MSTTTADVQFDGRIPRPAAQFRLGRWSVDPLAGELTGPGGGTVRLEPKVMAVLLELVRRPGEVLGKEDLLDAVWPDVTVTEDAVWRSIATLRRELGDDPRRPRYIETLPRRGYRLKPGLRPVAVDSPARPAVRTGARDAAPAPGSGAPLVAPPAAPGRPRRAALLRRGGLALAVLLGAVALALAFVRPRWAPSSSPLPSAGARADDAPSSEVADLTRAAQTYAMRRDMGDLARAAQLYRRALAAAPDDVAVLAGLANVEARRALERGGDAATQVAARRAAERAVELAPESAVAHKALGTVHHAAGRFAAAAAAYRRALELDPAQEAAQFNLAAVYVDSGELDRALDLLRSLPPSPVPEARALHLAALAEIHHLLGEDAAARDLVEQGLALAPASPSANVVAARLELAAGQPAVARDRLRAQAREHGSTPELTYWLARAEIAAGAPELARRQLDAAAPEGGPGLQLAGLRAWLAARAGEPAAARACAAPLLALGADSEVWYLHQAAAEAAAAVGDREGALERLRRSVARGGLDLRDVAADPALASVAASAEMGRLLDEMEQRIRTLRRRLGLDPDATPGWRSVAGWRDGERGVLSPPRSAVR